MLGLVDRDGIPTLLCIGDFEHLMPSIVAINASSSLEAITQIPDPMSPTNAVILLGLGSGSPSADTLRSAAGALTRKLRGVPSLVLRIPTSNSDEVSALAEGALLGTYSFTKYKSSQNDKAALARVSTLTLCTDVAVPDSLARIITAKAHAVELVKDLVNTPASDLTPEDLTRVSLESVSDLPISSHVWDEHELQHEGFGGILGVGRGSTHPPRLVRLDYSPVDAKSHVSLVGKGITFDTGGLTLKSGAGMVGMKYDMTGAATALAVIRAVATLQAPTRVTAWLCLAENMPSPEATKPNDVLTIRNGKTVEVLNTDAEGRLVLADGLSVASEEQPDLIIDIATLTGAAKGALGTRTVGAMGNPDAVSRLVESARISGEALWPMPLPAELRSLLDSDIADLINGRPGNTTAGMLLAGVFLSEFIGHQSISEESTKIPWIHLDIAGTADNSGTPYGFTGSGPTGVSVRALIDFLMNGA